MAKASPQFTCTECGAVHSKWSGRCDACGAWNSIIEEAPLGAGPKGSLPKGRVIALSSLQTQEPPPPRTETRNLYGMTGLIDMPSARVQPVLASATRISLGLRMARQARMRSISSSALPPTLSWNFV